MEVTILLSETHLVSWYSTDRGTLPTSLLCMDTNVAKPPWRNWCHWTTTRAVLSEFDNRISQGTRKCRANFCAWCWGNGVSSSFENLSSLYDGNFKTESGRLQEAFSKDLVCPTTNKRPSRKSRPFWRKSSSKSDGKKKDPPSKKVQPKKNPQLLKDPPPPPPILSKTNSRKTKTQMEVELAASRKLQNVEGQMMQDIGIASNERSSVHTPRDYSRYC